MVDSEYLSLVCITLPTLWSIRYICSLVDDGLEQDLEKFCHPILCALLFGWFQDRDNSAIRHMTSQPRVAGQYLVVWGAGVKRQAKRKGTWSIKARPKGVFSVGDPQWIWPEIWIWSPIQLLPLLPYLNWICGLFREELGPKGFFLLLVGLQLYSTTAIQESEQL